MSNVRSRKFCISWNNYPSYLTLDSLRDSFCKFAKVEYLIVAFEEGEEKHTPHVQGYVRFKNPQYFNSVRKLLQNEDGTYGYIEVANSSDLDNYRYCSKQGKFLEYGIKDSFSNSTTSLEELIDDILSDMSYFEICKKYYSYVLYHYRDFRMLYFDLRGGIEENERV